MQKFDAVEAWLSNVAYSHSPSNATGYSYRHYLSMFCEFIGRSPAQILDDYEKSDDRQFKRKYAQYVRAFISKAVADGYAVGSVTTMVSPVKSFFKYNDLPLGFVPISPMKVTYHNRDITREEIVEIMKMSNPREKAFFCMMAQSGLRPDTLCSLKFKHVEMLKVVKADKSVKVKVPEEITKGGYGSYFSFIGPETVKLLKGYLLKRHNIKPNDYLFTSRASDKRLNPKSVSGLFAHAVDKLKAKGIIDFEQIKAGKPRELRLYSLRKWFRKQAGHAGTDFVNFWMGHSLGVDAHYFSRDPEYHQKQYEEEAMPHLRLELRTPGVLEKQYEEQDKTIKQQAKTIKELERTIARLEAKPPEAYERYIQKQIEQLLNTRYSEIEFKRGFRDKKKEAEKRESQS